MPLSIYKLLRFTFAALFTVAIASCGGNPTAEDLTHLSGYWEIESVVFPNGETKEYPINTVIDYYSWDGTKGFLKKVQPEFSGRFLTNDDAIQLEIINREEMLVMLFSGENDTWEEELLALSSERMETRHQNGLTYRYKRFVPLISLE